MSTCESIGLCDLPLEILTHILTFCDTIAVCNAALVCKTLHEASKSATLWIYKVKNEFGIQNVDTMNWSYQETYQSLLYRYGHIIGLWQCKQSCYGAIIKAEFDPAECAITVSEILPPQSPHVTEPVRKKTLFVVHKEKEAGSKQIHCCYRYSERHTGTVNKVQLDGSDQGFHFHCEFDEVGHEDIFSPDSHLPQWIEQHLAGMEEDVILFGRQMWLKKWIAAYRREFNLTASPFDTEGLISNQSQMIIKPGIFKGTYSIHGLEFVKLSYASNEKIVVKKITGDENVPAGQVTNVADLSRPMVLSSIQQTEDQLLNADIPDMEPGFDLQSLPKQRFVIPYNWRSEVADVPDYCKARFHGQGQIAGSGFRSPQFTQGHWIVFDENTFGFLWLFLQAFSLYSRVKDDEL